jgi:pilus assembly protein FimV
MVPWLAAGLLTLLTSLLAYRLGQRRQNTVDSVQPAGPGSPLETLVMRQKAADQEALRTADEAVDRPALAPMLQQPEPPPVVLPEPTQPDPDPVRAQADLEVQALPDEAAGTAGQDSELDPRELDLEFEPEQPAQRPEASQQSMPASLDSLSLDLDDPPADRSLDLPDDSDDPLQTKLDLAEEFRAIGDEDGARSLIEEVIAGASGDLLSKAERALGRLK